MKISATRASRVARWALHLAVLTVGAIDAWSQRFAMNPDGVAYLDLAERYARGEWAAALNGVWSPLYPALLGAAIRLTRPSSTGTVILAHGVNFILYLAAYAAFLWLIAELQQRREPGRSDLWHQAGASALFVWATPGLASLGFIVPDIAAVGLVLATAAALLRLSRAPITPAGYAGFGALLAVGYLARTAFLLLAPLWLLVLHRSTGGRSPGFRIAWAAAGFVVVAGPLVLALSLDRGRPTFGESGRLNYAWYVNDLRVRRPLGPDARLAHPVRQLLDSPPVYEFAQPITGTYPVWTDPSYWQEGVTPRFDAAAQGRVLWHNLGSYGRLFAPPLAAGLVLAAAAIGLAGWRLERPIIGIIGMCLAAALLYALVHVERRYVAPFALVLLLTAGFALPAQATVSVPRFLIGVALGALALVQACGPANFVCGTGTTTREMLLLALPIMAGALLFRIWRTRVMSAAQVGCTVAVLGLPLLVQVDALILVLAVLLLAAMLVWEPDGIAVSLPGLWLTRATVGWALTALAVPMLAGTLAAARTSLRGEYGSGYAAAKTAWALETRGLQSGAEVASIGNTFEAYWARFARLRIVAEIPVDGAPTFWRAGPETQSRALTALGSSGARVVVADWTLPDSMPPGWLRVDDSHLMRWLVESEPQAILLRK